nr:hypothetical protein [Geobacter sp.]
MGVKFAKAFGAHVVVFTTSPGKKEDALRLGADEVHCINTPVHPENKPRAISEQNALKWSSSPCS